MPVNPAVLAAGAVLTAVQKVGGQTSPTTTSNKLVAVNARVVPPPKIEQPVRACDTALHVLECIPAADLVSENGGNSTLWTTIAADFWATGAAEFKPGQLKIFQRLPGAGTQSPDVVLTGRGGSGAAASRGCSPSARTRSAWPSAASSRAAC